MRFQTGRPSCLVGVFEASRSELEESSKNANTGSRRRLTIHPIESAMTEWLAPRGCSYFSCLKSSLWNTLDTSCLRNLGLIR
jgi:hypothetical protein